jgi:hypothetical protein
VKKTAAAASFFTLHPSLFTLSAYAVIATIAGLAYTFVTPPFQVPDEVGHYWRAASIGEGVIDPRTTPRGSVAELPRGVHDLVAATWLGPAGTPASKFQPDRWPAAWKVRDGRYERVMVLFPALYTPLPSAATAAAYATGVALHLQPLPAFYLGRLANLALYVALTSFAISLTPVAPLAFFAAASLPMPLFLAGSWSTDAATIALVFVLIAVILRTAHADGLMTPGELAAVVAAVLAAGFCKGVYAPSGILALAIPLRRFANRGRAAIAYTVIVVAMLAGAGVSAAVAHRNYFAARASENVSPGLQMRCIAADPGRFSRILANDILRRGPAYLEQVVGHLGWLNVRLPLALIAAELLLLVVATACASVRIHPSMRLMAMLAFAAGITAVLVSQYLVWTPVCSPALEGVQGRYFVPLLPLAIVALAGSLRAPRALRVAVPLMACIANIVGVAAVWAHYY